MPPRSRAPAARPCSVGRFRATAKNAPASDVFARHGFTKAFEDSADGSTWQLDLGRQSVTTPEWIGVEICFVNETVLLDVRRIAADVLRKTIDEVPADRARATRISGWDSMAHVNLVLAIEQHFDVQFKPEEMLEMLSIELTAMLVEEKLAERGAR